MTPQTPRPEKDDVPEREPTDEQIEAAYNVIRDEVEMHQEADVYDYVNGPDDPPPGPKRDAAFARLRQADEAVEAENRDIIRRALRAALNV